MTALAKDLESSPNSEILGLKSYEKDADGFGGDCVCFRNNFHVSCANREVSGFNDNIAPVQLAQTDSIISLVAEAQGLQLVPSDQVPFCGTFWMVLPGPSGITAPLPCPPLDPSLPIYAIADGQFLVDGTIGGGGFEHAATAGRQATSSTSAAALEVQANAVVNLITRVQTAAANQQMRTMARAMGMNVPSPGGDGSGDGSLPMFSSTFTIDTNGLWLEITNVSGGVACLNLHNASNQVMPFGARPICWKTGMWKWKYGR